MMTSLEHLKFEFKPISLFKLFEQKLLTSLKSNDKKRLKQGLLRLKKNNKRLHLSDD